MHFLTIIISILLLPLFYIYRKFLCTLKKYFPDIFPPHLTSPIEGLDGVFCGDDFHRDCKGGISYVCLCSGAKPLDPLKVLEKFEKVLSSSRDYDRLTSLVPVPYGGIVFWGKTRQTFEGRKHLKIIETLGQWETLEELIVHWMRCAFNKGRPLWEILIVKQFERGGRQMSLLGFKSHHILGDGISKLELLEKIFDRSQTSQKQKLITLQTSSSTLPKLPHMLRKIGFDFFLHRDVFSGKKTFPQKVSLFVASLPLKDVATLRHKVMPPAPLSLVGLVILGRVLKKVFKGTGPTNFLLSLPLPIKRPIGYVNHWGHSLLTLDLSEGQTMNESLNKLLDAYVNDVGVKRFPETFHYWVTPLLGVIPHWLWRWVVGGVVMGSSIGMSNLRGPDEQVELCGTNVEEFWGYVGLLWSHASLTCAVVSYNGTLTMTLLVNNDLLASTIRGKQSHRLNLEQVLKEEIASWQNE